MMTAQSKFKILFAFSLLFLWNIKWKSESFGFCSSYFDYRDACIHCSMQNKVNKKCLSTNLDKKHWYKQSTSQLALNGEVSVLFGNETECKCKVGDNLLTVGEACGAMKEISTRQYCRQGSCYNCEVEIMNFESIEGLGDPIVRACLFKIPQQVAQLQIQRLDTDDGWEVY
mmetsp:Transcript_34640/g.45801  ORF Transcript_34640/g.45801 Transcript_34640/m.45801 type:complete len:171 (-) Transcript_34640:126-638(-)